MKPIKLSFKALILLIAIGFLINSCSSGSNAIHRKQIASEILCPDGKNYLIRYAYADEVLNAIRKDYMRKITAKSSESFTIMIISGVESFVIEQTGPEKLINCKIKQGLLNDIYPRYVHRFGNSPGSQFENMGN